MRYSEHSLDHVIVWYDNGREEFSSDNAAHMMAAVQSIVRPWESCPVLLIT